MIQYTDIFNINYYKKEIFHGSYKSMRYQIKKGEKKDADESAVLLVTTWPGPYNFETTAQEQKQYCEFEFSNDGLKQAVDYLNQQYQQHYLTQR